jgi:hypothetical protein
VNLLCSSRRQEAHISFAFASQTLVKIIFMRKIYFLATLLIALGTLPVLADSDPAHMSAGSEKPQPWPGGIIPYDISKLTQPQ